MNMKKIGEVEDCKVAAVGEMAAAQLVYFKVCDKEISTNQRGLIEAVYSLSNVLGMEFASHGTRVPRSSPSDPLPPRRNIPQCSPPTRDAEDGVLP
jgi:hypothetical protein